MRPRVSLVSGQWIETKSLDFSSSSSQTSFTPSFAAAARSANGSNASGGVQPPPGGSIGERIERERRVHAPAGEQLDQLARDPAEADHAERAIAQLTAHELA